MSCNHDWYDDYKAYTRMNAGRTNRGGGDDWGYLIIILLAVLSLPIFYVFMVILDLIGSGILALFEYLNVPSFPDIIHFLQGFAGWKPLTSQSRTKSCHSIKSSRAILLYVQSRSASSADLRLNYGFYSFLRKSICVVKRDILRPNLIHNRVRTVRHRAYIAILPAQQSPSRPTFN